MNLKKVYNFFTLFLFILYFLFLVSRVILERNAIDALQIVGFILFIYLCFSLGLTIVFVFKRYFKGNLVEKIVIFLDVRFFQQFLDKIKFFNFVFFFIAYRMSYLITNFFYIIPIVILYIPWVLFLLTFGYELLFEDKVLTSLYILSFCFLIKRVVILLFFITVNKFKKLVDITFDRYLLCFDRLFRSRYVAGFRWKEMLFNEPVLQNRAVFKYLWDCNAQLRYYYENQSLAYALKYVFIPTESVDLTQDIEGDKTRHQNIAGEKLEYHQNLHGAEEKNNSVIKKAKDIYKKSTLDTEKFIQENGELPPHVDTKAIDPTRLATLKISLKNKKQQDYSSSNENDVD